MSLMLIGMIINRTDVNMRQERCTLRAMGKMTAGNGVATEWANEMD